MSENHPVVAGVMADTQGVIDNMTHQEFRIMIARIVGFMVALIIVVFASDAEAARRGRKVSVQRSSCSTSCQNGTCTTAANSSSRTVTHGGSIQATHGTHERVRAVSVGKCVGPNCSGGSCQSGGILMMSGSYSKGKSVRTWSR